MFLKFEIKQDALMLSVQTGPKEKYDPDKYPEIVDLFEETLRLDKEIKSMREKINPKLKKIEEIVKNFNKKQLEKSGS